ncbi:MAG: hypothetical protein ACUVUF_07810 [Candidatus Bathycorpusculaceae bacterium]
MKRQLKSGKITYPLSEYVEYFLLALYFGWSKEEVDKMDADYVAILLELIKLLLEEESEELSRVEQQAKLVRNKWQQLSRSQ